MVVVVVETVVEVGAVVVIVVVDFAIGVDVGTLVVGIISVLVVISNVGKLEAWKLNKLGKVNGKTLVVLVAVVVNSLLSIMF